MLLDPGKYVKAILLEGLPGRLLFSAAAQFGFGVPETEK